MTHILETGHFFSYDVKDEITPAMLADNLLGLEGVVKCGVQALSRVTEVRIRKSKVIITSVEIGSYKDYFSLRLLLGNEKEMEKKIEEIRRKLGLQNMSAKQIIGIFIVGAVGVGAYMLLKPKDEPARIAINNSFNNWAVGVGMSGEELMAHVANSVTNHEELKKNVVRLLHPKKSAQSGKVVLDEDENLSIPEVVTSSIPHSYKPSDQDTRPEDFNGVTIVVRAADIDSNKKGWSAIFEQVSTKRIPLQVEQRVDTFKIPLGKNIKADITVFYKMKKNGDIVPKQYLLREVLPD